MRIFESHTFYNSSRGTERYTYDTKTRILVFKVSNGGGGWDAKQIEVNKAASRTIRRNANLDSQALRMAWITLTEDK